MVMMHCLLELRAVAIFLTECEVDVPFSSFLHLLTALWRLVVSLNQP